MMHRPRRIIFYLSDGVSAAKVNSFNSAKVNKLRNPKVKTTFYDKLFKQSYSFRTVYGYDNTQPSMYALFSGQTHQETPISMPSVAPLLRLKRHIVRDFKKMGYRTSFFSNNHVANYTIPADHFDNFKLKPFAYRMQNTELPDTFWGKDGKPTFLFVHDLYTHDKGGKYAKGDFSFTIPEYEKYVKQGADNIEKNLEYLKFDPSKDMLVLFSDHGMTIGTKYVPKGSAIMNEERLKHWAIAGKEIKTRVMFMVKYDGIKQGVQENVTSLIDAFTFVMNSLGVDDYPSKVYRKYNFSNEAITASMGIYPVGLWAFIKKRLLKERMFHFTYVKADDKGSKKKWIYQFDLHKGEFYDLEKDPMEEKPKNVSFHELPDKMRGYMKAYNKTRFDWFHILLSKLCYNVTNRMYKAQRKRNIAELYPANDE